MNRKPLFCIMLMALACSSLFFVDNSSAANASAVVSAVQSGTTSISSWSVAPNSTIVVDVRVDNAEAVWGWEFSVNWTVGILNLTRVQKGTYLPSSSRFMGSSPLLWNLTGGYILGGEGGILGSLGKGDAPVTDSSGVLAKLTFDVIGNGTASIVLSKSTFKENDRDQYGTIPTMRDATVRVMGEAEALTKIDVFTGKSGKGLGAFGGAYGPNELLRIYGNVTYDGTAVASRDVSIAVAYNGSIYDSRVATTNATGIAHIELRLPSFTSSSEAMFGNWTITATAVVSEITVNDTTQFMFGFLSGVSGVQVPTSIPRLGVLRINVTINSLSNATGWSSMHITLFDAAQVPIGSFSKVNTLTATNQTVNATIPIPNSAFLGQATAYICLLASDGTPVAPETTAVFQITSNPAQNGNNPAFVVPEYTWGALGSLMVAFAVFAGFTIRKKRKTRPE
jgi:hypothetical protein